MRVGLGQFRELTDEMLAFIKQMGADDFLMNTPDLPGEEEWAYEDLKALKEKADAAGLRLQALENVPVHFYERIMLNLPGRDEQIVHMSNTIKNMGKAGIPILGYHWMPNKVWRTEPLAELRGGARATRFDMAKHGDAPNSHEREFTQEEMVENFDYYLERILPVAEEAGVVLALHPDDPPVPTLWRSIPSPFPCRRSLEPLRPSQRTFPILLRTFMADRGAIPGSAQRRAHSIMDRIALQSLESSTPN